MMLLKKSTPSQKTSTLALINSKIPTRFRTSFSSSAPILSNYGLYTPKIVKKQASASKQAEWKQATPKQKYLIYKIYPDIDKDGTPDIYDCEPKNPQKQDFAKTRTGIPIADFASMYGYQKTHVRMSPNEFLKHTQSQGTSRIKKWPLKEYESAVIQPVKIERLKKKIASPYTEVDVPLLELEKGRVVEHEGRHRAVAARELGYKKIPVVIVETGKKKIL